MKKKALSLLLSVLLCALLLPVMATAAPTGTHTHCICGVDNCGLNHDGTNGHGTDVTFTAWTDALAQKQNGVGRTASNSLPKEPGSYYLTKDVTLGDTWYPGNVINLCLNGHDISGNVRYLSRPIIGVSGTLSITCCDTALHGRIAQASGHCGIAVQVYGGNTLYLYNGRLEDNNFTLGSETTNYRGGGGIRNEGTTYMYGGTIQRNGADGSRVYMSMQGTNYGGGIRNSGTFCMYGGTVQNNDGQYGGGVYNTGEFYMYGGTITGNRAEGYDYSSDNTDYTAYGGGICNTGEGKLYLYGGTISNNTASATGSKLKCRVARGGGVYNGPNATLVLGDPDGSDTTAITGNSALTSADKDENYGSYGGGIFNAGTMTVNNGSFTNNKASSTQTASRAYGGGIYNAGTLEVKNATFTGNSAYNGGAIANGSAIGAMNGNPVLTLTGAVTLSSNKATNGGALYNNAALTIPSTVTITGNSASDGGAIYHNSGALKLNTDITDNTATNNGGGVFSRSTFDFNSGTISGNQALSSTGGAGGGAGGGVYSTGTFTMNDTMNNTKIDNNTAGVGGGVYNGGGTFMFNGGTISNNKAVRGSQSNTGLGAGGGGVYNAATFTMNGGTINDNTAAKDRNVSGGGAFCHGGGVYNANTVNLYGGFILNNAASNGNGGGIYHNGYSLNVNATVSVSRNTAHNGGGIYLNSGSTTFTGGVVQSNTAHYGYGGGVYYYSGTSLSISGQTRITDNERVQYDGGSGRDITENLLLNEGCKVNVGSLFGSAKIGVSTNETPTAGNFTSAVVLSKNAPGSNCLKYMTADEPDYQLATNSNNELVLLNACEHGNVTSRGKCNNCGAQMAAKVEDEYYNPLKTRYYTTVAEAVKDVQTNDIVILYTPLTENIVLDTNKTYRFDARTGSAENASISITAGTVELMGEFGTVSVGAAANVKFFGYDTSIKCLMTTWSAGVGSMLQNGWVFKTTDEGGNVTWHDSTCRDKTLYNVELAKLPLYSVSITPATVSALTYSYSSAPELTVNATGVNGFGEYNAPHTTPVSSDDDTVTYEWYVGSTPMGVNSTSFTFPADKSVGEYKVTCVATKDGYSKKSNEVTVTVDPATVEVNDDFTVDSKDYNGSTNATVSGLTVAPVGGGTNLTEGTDYTVTAAFADANAGTDKTVNVTVTLLNKNYKFAGGTSVYADSSKRANINQRTAETPADVTRYVKANGGETYTYVINALLHTINDRGSYGALSSSTVSFAAEAAANQYTITYSVEDDTKIKFTPTLEADGTAATENTKLGTLTVTTKTTNYSGTGENGEITLKIAIVATNKTIPNLGSDLNDPIILQTREIPYGTKLSEIPLQQQDGINPRAFSWDDGRSGATVLSVGTHWVGWKFTPTDTTYAEIQGSVPITVYKVTPDVRVGTNNVLSKTYDGQPMEITGTANNPYIVGGDTTVSGTWSWKDANAPVSVNDSGNWKVVFTPDDLNNYYVVEKDVSVTILKRTVTLSGITAASRTYEVGNDTVLLSGGELSRAASTGGNDDSTNPPTEGPGGASSLLLRAAAPNNTGIIEGDDVGFTLGVGRLVGGGNVGEKQVTTAVVLTGADAGNYTLTQPTGLTATISPRSISDATVVIADAAYNNGESVNPTVKVYLHGLELTAGTDYTLSGTTSANVVGNYTLTVTGKGNYKDAVDGIHPWHVVKGTVSDSKSVPVTATVAQAARGLTQRLISADGSWGAGVRDINVDDDRLPSNVTATIQGGVLYYTIANGRVGDIVTIPVLFTSDYYEGVIPVNIVVTLTDDGTTATGGGHYHGGSGNSSVNSADTGDAGIALYAALSLSSLTGMALVHKKKK